MPQTLRRRPASTNRPVGTPEVTLMGFWLLAWLDLVAEPADGSGRWQVAYVDWQMTGGQSSARRRPSCLMAVPGEGPGHLT